ncbi:MAG: nucleotidyltransferase family protein [Deltaproteobacteria bacterium]|nr:nucleotidyltransferase family protein [Deltaproteobacteria bacterium]
MEVGTVAETLSATVRGRSMEPTLFDGDLVQFSALSPGAVRAGAIYAFDDPNDGSRIMHRCASRTNGALLFQGDRQPWGERMSVETHYFKLERILDRRVEPGCAEIAFGLIRHIDGIGDFEFPKNTTHGWPWEKLFKFCAKHRILTAFGLCLKQSQLWEQTPAEFRELFQLDLYQATQRAERISAVIGRVRALLPLGRLLKGAALRDELYPTPVIRTMADVDILVGQPEFFSGIEILVANGFTITDAWRHQAKTFHEAQLTHEPTGLTLELHRAVFQKFRYKFNSAEFLRSGDSVDELLYLCAHSLTHFGQHGLNYWEIFRYLSIRKPDLSGAAERARQQGALLAYVFALRLLKHCWNADFDAAAEGLLNSRQKLALETASLFYIDATGIEMMSFRKRLLQTLVADDLLSLLRLVLDKDRIHFTHFASS